MHQIIDEQTIPTPDPADSLLTEVELSPEAMAAMARQGFVRAEQRGRRSVVYKLRFRLGGRQVVRYLGTDRVRAQAVQAALDTWQVKRRMEVTVNQKTSLARLLSWPSSMIEHDLGGGHGEKR